MRLEKLSLKHFEGPLVEGGLKRPYVPPSLVPEAPGAKAEPPPPPTFTEAELKNAEQEGYRKGFLEGTKEGQLQTQSEHAEIERLLTGAVEQLYAQVQGVITEYNRFVEMQKEELPRVALAIARKVAGVALDTNPLPLIESLVIACVERMLGEPHLTVTVNDRLSDMLETRLIAHFEHSSEPGEISIQGDANFAPGDCRIEWAGGKAEHNTEQLWQQMQAIIQEMVESARISAPHTDQASASLAAANPSQEGA